MHRRPPGPVGKIRLDRRGRVRTERGTVRQSVVQRLCPTDPPLDRPPTALGQRLDAIEKRRQEVVAGVGLVGRNELLGAAAVDLDLGADQPRAGVVERRDARVELLFDPLEPPVFGLAGGVVHRSAPAAVESEPAHRFAVTG